MSTPVEPVPPSPGPPDDDQGQPAPSSTPTKSTGDSAASYVMASLFICGAVFVSLVMAAFSQITLEGCDGDHTCHYTAYHLGVFSAAGGPFIAPLIAGILNTVTTRRAKKAGEAPPVFDSGVLWQIFGIQTLTIIVAFLLLSAVDPT